jgi:hypothetical protein
MLLLFVLVVITATQRLPPILKRPSIQPTQTRPTEITTEEPSMEPTQSYDCDMRTVTFQEHGINNDNGYYFVPMTYGAGTYKCNTINNNTQFRDKINSMFECTYSHCMIDNTWGCNFGDSQNCYNVEHIIPKNNKLTELSDCNTNIYGNLIMAYGKWNTELSNGYLDEKILIYGDIFTNAYTSVYECCHNHPPTSVPKCDYTYYKVIILLCICSIVIVIFTIVYLYYIKLNNHQ